jgi:hypothetical protein
LRYEAFWGPGGTESEPSERKGKRKAMAIGQNCELWVPEPREYCLNAGIKRMSLFAYCSTAGSARMPSIRCRRGGAARR